MSLQLNHPVTQSAPPAQPLFSRAATVTWGNVLSRVSKKLGCERLHGAGRGSRQGKEDHVMTIVQKVGVIK